MRNGHPVIDSDGHTYEPEDLYERYLDPSFRDRVKTVGQVSMGKWIREVDGKMTGSVDPAAGEDPGAPLTVAKVMAAAPEQALFDRREND